MPWARGSSAQRFAGSFAAYEGASLFFAGVREHGLVNTLGPEENKPDSEGILRRMKQVFSKRNLEKKLKWAPSSADRGTPLFVVGMPRAGFDAGRADPVEPQPR